MDNPNLSSVSLPSASLKFAEPQAHTTGPWTLGTFDDALGYDCMTGGIHVGPAYLDGEQYGQRRCTEIAPEARARMEADARLIAAAPDMLAVIQRHLAGELGTFYEMKSVVAKAIGGADR